MLDPPGLIGRKVDLASKKVKGLKPMNRASMLKEAGDSEALTEGFSTSITIRTFAVLSAPPAAWMWSNTR
jgi:hypothetical protein